MPRISAAVRVELLLFAFALAIRGLYVLDLSTTPIATMLSGDAVSYDSWARRITAGDWLGRHEGVFYQAPLYPYFLAAVYSLAGAAHVTVVYLVQIVLGSIACVLLLRAGRSFCSEAVGRFAGFALAIYPSAIFYDGQIQKASLDLFLMCLVLYALATARDNCRARPWVFAGASLGALTLNRENAMVLVAIVFAERLWSLRRNETSWRSLVGVAAGVAVVLLPVAFRNLAIGGEFHLTTSQLGPNFFIGNNPGANGTYMPLRPGRGNAQYERDDARELAEQTLGRSLTPGEVSRFWLDESLRYISSQPWSWLKLMGRKWLLLINRAEASDTVDQSTLTEYSRVLRWPSRVLHFGLIVPLATLGLWLSRERARELRLPLLLLAGYTASTVAFYVFARYRFPMVPLLLLFAGLGVAESARRFRQGGAPTLVAPIALAVVVAIAAALPLVDETRQRSVTLVSIGNHLAGDVGEFGLAKEAFRKSIELNPEYGKAHVALANLLAISGQTDEALDHYRFALAHGPDFPEAHFNYGLTLARLGRHREAADQFLEAVKLDPRNARVHAELGRSLQALGQNEEAARHFAIASRLDPASVGTP